MNNDPFFGNQPNGSPDQQPVTPPPAAPIVSAPTGSAPVEFSPTPVQGGGASKMAAVLALILGIAAMLSGFMIIGIPVGVAAIIIGAITLKKRKPGKGFAVGGIITGALGILTGLGVLIVGTLLVAGVGPFKIAPIEKADYEIAFEKKMEIDAMYIAQKKDFAIGETAQFGPFEVKVNSVKDGYTLPQPNRSDYGEDTFTYVGDVRKSNPSKGNRWIIVNFTIKNTGKETQEQVERGLTVTTTDGGKYTNELESPNTGLGGFRNEILYKPLFREAWAGTNSVTLDPGQEITADMAVDVPIGTDAKLMYEMFAIDPTTQENTTLIYTLDF